MTAPPMAGLALQHPADEGEGLRLLHRACGRPAVGREDIFLQAALFH